MQDYRAGDEFQIGEYTVKVVSNRSGLVKLDFFDKDGKRVKVGVRKGKQEKENDNEERR